MVSRVGMLLWAWIILDLGACSAVLPEITERKFIDECVKEHNAARSAASPSSSDMMYMSWDEGLAISARAWARHCRFEHNPRLKNDDPRIMHPTFPSVGENIWVGYPPSTFDVTGAIKNWVDEKKDYDYQTKICTRNKMCGHYTQIVWAKSYKVGCAAVLCPGGIARFDPQEGVVFVCNYAIAGNIRGRQPYQSQGAACSRCTGSCVDRLCRDKERDSEKSNYWVPDWDPAARDPAAQDPAAQDPTQSPPASNYISILIVRPVALIFSFITAYVVHHYYPDVFCYE